MKATLLAPSEEVAHALRLLITEGLLCDFHSNAAKTLAFKPTISAHQGAMLERVLALTTVTEGDIKLLGAPIGCEEFIRSRLRA